MTMEFKSYENKSMSKRIVLLSIIVLISVSLLFYKNNNLKENKDNVYFAFYNGNEKLDSMPQKNNADDLLFSHAECDNGAYVEWNKEEWAPLVKNLSKSKTKCKLYFGKPIELGKEILPVESGDGLYAVNHDVSEISTDWNKTEYRFAGANPNNYVSFNNEIWRMIGLVNVITDTGVEQRLKIVRTNSIAGQKDFGDYAWNNVDYPYTNNWTTSKLKDMLNGIYFESTIGECYTASNGAHGLQTTCDFSGKSELPLGLNGVYREMIDKDVTWNLGGWTTGSINVEQFYEKERGLTVSNDYPTKWNKETNVGNNFNGIGLIYPSDYGYSTNGGNLGRSTCFNDIYIWGSTENNYQSECGWNSWIRIHSNVLWTLSPYTSYYYTSFIVSSSGNWDGTRVSRSVLPTLYLKSTVKILSNPHSEQEYGTVDNPMKLSY